MPVLLILFSSNPLTGWAPAIRRAVREAEERRHRRRVETELIRREQYFRTLTENSLDLLIIIDQTGVLQYASPSLVRVLGYEPKDLMGQSVFALVHPEDLPGVLGEFEIGLKNPQQTLTVQLRVRHQNGDVEASRGGRPEQVG